MFGSVNLFLPTGRTFTSDWSANCYIMVTYENLFKNCSQNSLVLKLHYENVLRSAFLFTDESEVSALPVGFVCKSHEIKCIDLFDEVVVLKS